MPTAASLPVISAALPKLTRLGLPRSLSWDEAALAHLATLTCLTALSMGHNDSAGGMAQYSTFFQCLAALPRLADITLHLQSSSSLSARPAIFRRTDGAPSPLRSVALNIAGGRAYLSAITQHLGAAPFLTHLSASGSLAALSDDLVHLTSVLPALRRLCLENVTMSDEANAKLSGLSQLTALTLLYSIWARSRASSALAHLGSLQPLTTNLEQQLWQPSVG